MCLCQNLGRTVLSQSKSKDTTKEDCLFINVDTSGASLTFSAFPV